MYLTLITPPAAKVVAVADLCQQLRVTSSDEWALIEALELAAVAHLDGWKGVLGRAIRPQVWKQEFDAWGYLRLAMPDVSAITVTALDSNGAAVTATRADLRVDASGPYVITEGPSVDRVFVQFTCGMQTQQIPAVQAAVRMMVAHWFNRRETAVEGQMSEIPFGADTLIHSMRWSQF